MKHGRKYLILHLLLAIIISLTALGGWQNPAKADTCNWQGGNGDWATPGNWSCGHVPTESDDIVIDQPGVGPQIDAATMGIDVNSITIASGAMMTVNATTTSLTAYANSFTNAGEIIINGFRQDYLMEGLAINSPGFANNGTVTINAGYLNLHRGGTHSGDFVGGAGTVLSLGSSWPDSFTFTEPSLIQVPEIMVVGSGGYAPTVNIAGEFSPWLVSETDSRMDIMGSGAAKAVVNFTTTNVLMPYEVVVSTGTLNLPALSLDIPKLKVMFSTLHNPSQLRIMDYLELSSYTLTGSGGILVDSQASTFTLRGGTISGKTIYNPITANWVSGNITLADGAIFQNNGTFNAKATTTMTETAAESFINNGSFVKMTEATTTTMNIPFTNNGTVETVAGTLVFLKGMDNGENAVIDLGGGTLDPGTTLNLASGDSLVGSGTLAADLVNAGTVSPGNSAGSVTIQGDYTQESSGVLEIQLGGTTAGTQYDQLTVTGTATLAGTLNVSLIDGFIPQVGDSFTILPYGTRSGSFFSLSRPESYRWGIDYGYSGLTLTVLEGGSISGTVTCNSNHTVFVDLWVEDTDPPPEDHTTIACGESYSFTNLPDGTYNVGAWIDLNESGGGPPDEGEPYAWYGAPTAVSIIDGESKTGIDITIEGGFFELFLPLILR